MDNTDPSAWVEKDKGYDDIKHAAERVEFGFSTYDWWNFCDYMAWVNIQALEKFKTGNGHPVDENIQTMDDWIFYLDAMIEGFKAHQKIANLDYETRDEAVALNELRKEGLALYAKYFPSLWD